MPKPVYGDFIVAEVINIRTPAGIKKALDENYSYIYIGRGLKGQSHLLNTDPREDGWLGNPYRLEDYGNNRVKVISLYHRDFKKRLKDPKFKRALLGILKGCQKPKIRLGCFCHPLACHGHVIADWINRREIKWR